MQASPIAACGTRNGLHSPPYAMFSGWTFVVSVSPLNARMGPLSPVDDVLDTLAGLGVGRCHLVGASFGAGVAVEVALTSPEQVDSLLLAAPGGSLIAEATPDLRAFIDAERSAMARDDLAEAVEANLTWWVDGPRRDARAGGSRRSATVRRMQRRRRRSSADWDGTSR